MTSQPRPESHPTPALTSKTTRVAYATQFSGRRFLNLVNPETGATQTVDIESTDLPTIWAALHALTQARAPAAPPTSKWVPSEWTRIGPDGAGKIPAGPSARPSAKQFTAGGTQIIEITDLDG